MFVRNAEAQPMNDRRRLLVARQRPGQERETILCVPRYDFNNQPYYRFEKPITVEAGTKVILTVHFNNSAVGPNRNRSLTKKMADEEVRFGVQTDREMCFGYLTVAFDTTASLTLTSLNTRSADMCCGCRNRIWAISTRCWVGVTLLS